MKRSRIVGIGTKAPDQVLDNHELEKMVETSDEWIQTRTGIRERRIGGEGTVTSDLANEACRTALERAGLEPTDVDLLVLATATPDMPLPSTACHVQRKLGAKNAAVFDVEAGCSGFLYALSTADAFIQSGKSKTALVVGVEMLSRVTNWKDRTTCVLFGDGAGAAVLTADDGDRGVLSTHLHSDGEGWDLICIPGGGTQHPQGEKTLKENLHYIHMQGRQTFKVAVNSLVSVCKEALEHNDVTVDDIDHVVSHQANSRIISATMDRLKVPDEKVHVNLDRYGNTSAASIPITMDEVLADGKIKEGDLILMAAFGAGLTWGSALVRW